MGRVNGASLLLSDSWEAARAIEREHRVGVQLALVTKTRKHVWGVRMRVYSLVDGKAHRCLVERSEEYPNSQVETLEALLLRLTNDVAARTEEAIALLREQAEF
jgi:hypothetical protein